MTCRKMESNGWDNEKKFNMSLPSII